MESKRDIESREDLAMLVQRFYDKLLVDPLMAPIFLEVAKIDLESHLPVLVDFWEGILLQGRSYRGNTMQVHLDLHQQFPLEEKHFDRWLALFDQSLDELYVGELARQAKVRALSIATVIKIKIYQQGLL